MAAFVVKNPKNHKDVVGTAGEDRLTVTFTTDGAVLNTISADGTSGIFFGPAGAADDFRFSGIENITFDHKTGRGDDFVGTGGGDDVISTGLGDDTIQSGSGVDRIDGGQGVDLWGANLSAETKGVRIDLAATSSTYLKTGLVKGVEGFRNFHGTQGRDVLASTRLAASTIFGEGGDDTISVYGTAGFSSVDGGAGEDRLIVDYVSKAAVVALYRGGGTGYLTTGSDIDDGVVFTGFENFTLTTGTGNDSIQTSAGDDIISTGAGADTIYSGAGIDRIDGGAGVDLWGADLSAMSKGVKIDLAAASTTIFKTGFVKGVEGFASFAGTQGADTLSGTKLAGSTVFGVAGDDVIKVFGGAGFSSVNGGDGDDRLIAIFAGQDDVTITISGTSSGYFGTVAGERASTRDDVAFEQIENFTIQTGGGADSLQTGFGVDNGLYSDDWISSGAGNDTLYTGVGRDTIDGGAGVDLWGGNLVLLSHGVTIDLRQAVSTYGEGTSIKGVEGFNYLGGTAFDDVFAGTSRAGSTIFGGNGDDDFTVYMNGGNNSVDGGDGVDRLTIVLNDQVTQEGAGQGNGYYGTFTDGVHTTSYYAMQDFSLLYDGPKTISIHGLDGADSLTAGSGNDTLSGYGGTDTIIGGAGADLIAGNQGVDVVTGGAGADTFYFAVNDTFAAPDAFDTIRDFATGVDRIDLATVEGALQPSAYAEGAVASDAFAALLGRATALMADGTKSVVFVAGSTNGWLFYSTDGDPRTAEAAVRLVGLNSVGDFASTDIV